jgi:hypothetical protein
MAAAPGWLRASHADRERTIGVVKAAFVQGRLAKEEFDARIGQVLTSRTYAELAAVTSDILVAPPAPRPAREPSPVRHRPVSYAVKWAAYGFIAPAVVTAALAVASLSGSALAAGLVLLAFLYFVVWVPTSSRDGDAGNCRRGQHPGSPSRLALDHGRRGTGGPGNAASAAKCDSRS